MDSSIAEASNATRASDRDSRDERHAKSRTRARNGGADREQCDNQHDHRSVNSTATSTMTSTACLAARRRKPPLANGLYRPLIEAGAQTPKHRDVADRTVAPHDDLEHTSPVMPRRRASSCIRL